MRPCSCKFLLYGTLMSQKYSRLSPFIFSGNFTDSWYKHMFNPDKLVRCSCALMIQNHFQRNKTLRNHSSYSFFIISCVFLFIVFIKHTWNLWKTDSPDLQLIYVDSITFNYMFYSSSF